MAMLSLSQLEELQKFDTPTIWNALEGFKIRPNTTGFTYPGLQFQTPAGRSMVGYAVTAKVSGLAAPTAEQKEMLFSLYADVRRQEGPAVVVIEDIDLRPIGSFWGEVQATTFMALGAVGTLTQGGVRDLNEVGPLGFCMSSTEVMVARAESHVIAHDCAVEICGLQIVPGDLLHVDRHGATVIPAEFAPVLAEACRKVIEAEKVVLIPCRQAIEMKEKPTIDQLRHWRAEMASRR